MIDSPKNLPNRPEPQPLPALFKELWPSSQELGKLIGSDVQREIFDQLTSELDATGDFVPSTDESPNLPGKTFLAEAWRSPAIEGSDIIDLRPLAVFGDLVTTDHISPSGDITPSSPAGQYLIDHGTEKDKLASFNSHPEDHYVMARRTFSDAGLKNLMTPGIQGGYTQYFGDAHVAVPDQKIEAAPNAKPTYIYDASVAYRQSGRKLIIIAGEDYGSGPAHTSAAKGTALLGVKAVISKSYQDSHRSHLIGVGILPLTFKNAADYNKIKNMHACTFSITSLAGELKPMQEALLKTSCGLTLPVVVRLEGPAEIDCYLSGGILPRTLRQTINGNE